MPYSDPQRKQQWEQQHRVQRLARRRELHRIVKAHQETTRTADNSEGGNAALVWAPLLVGGALASYDPKLAMGVGGLTIVAAALGKKGAGWWIVGAIILITGCVFYWSSQREADQGNGGREASSRHKLADFGSGTINRPNKGNKVHIN